MNYQDSTRLLACAFVLALAVGAGQPAVAQDAPGKAVKLPGLEIKVKERCVDVEAEVCLDDGTLELVACTKETKEHESILVVGAKAMHIHTALLLLGTKNGSPAMQKRVGEEGEERWVDVMPSGGEVDVFLVFSDAEGKTVERPISDFIKRVEDEFAGGVEEPEGDSAFPTHTFLFAGSHLHDGEDGRRRYLADASGNVISISTFGDELLCLPGVHGHQNGALLWEVDAEHLPKVGAKVTLRLRPKREEKGGAKEE